MWQGTVLRVCLLVFIGILLYVFLLYFIGWRADIRLKKRKICEVKEQVGWKNRIVLFYLIVLTIILSLGFLIIKYFIRGVK